MKKTYMKPEINMIDFSISGNIMNVDIDDTSMKFDQGDGDMDF